MNTIPAFHHSLRSLALALALPAASLLAADQTITGNLTVTGTADIDGNSLALGTQSSSPGLLLSYADTSADTLTFYLNRNPGSFLWAHTSAIAAMRLTANHELVLYKSDGTTAGLTLTPATNTISLGATTLYRDGTTGALRTNGALTIDGAFTAPTFVTSNGTLTGGATGLTLQAGGTNQNITVTPSGTGYTVLNGNVGIGTATPAYKLDVAGDINISAGSGYKQAGQTILYAVGGSTFVGTPSGNTSHIYQNNTGIGAETLLSLTTGNSNVAIGSKALRMTTEGFSNIAFGERALELNTTGTRNTAIGALAMAYNVSGYDNVGIGERALSLNTGGYANVAVGKRAGLSTTGSNNLLLGYFAGYNLTTGSNNIAIGYNVDVPSPTGSHQLTLGNLLYGVGVNGTGTTVSTGSIGIGTASPAYRLDVAGDINFTGTLRQSGTPLSLSQWLTTGSAISYGTGGVRVGGSTTPGLFGVGAVGTADNGSFEVFANPTSVATLPGESWHTQSAVRGVASDSGKAFAASQVTAQEVSSDGTRNALYSIAYTPASYTGGVTRMRAVTGIVRHASTGAVGNLQAGLFMASSTSTGTVSRLTGVAGLTENVQGSVTLLTGVQVAPGNAATATTAVGVDIGLTNTGTIGDAYGVRIGSLSGGTVTNNVYALHSSDPKARTHLAGALQAEGAIALGGAAVTAPAWGATGAQVQVKAATLTDDSTAASGTAATAVFTSFAAPTLAATNAGVTTTQAATVYIAGGPTAGANQTIAHSYGLWNAGKTRLDGPVRLAPQGDLSMGSFTTEP